jgi:transposase
VARGDLAGVEKKARRERRTSVFIDESGFYLLPGVVRTYAPCGVTPVLRPHLTRAHLSVMSGVTPCGRLYTLTRRRPLRSAECIAFLGHVRRMVGGRLLAVWDGSPIHRSREIKAFLAGGGSQFVHLERLPAYAPELNPDEGVWQHLKHVELRNLCCRDLDHLSAELSLAVKRLREKPSLIQAFFAGAGLDA